MIQKLGSCQHDLGDLKIDREILIVHSDKTAWEEFKKVFADTEYRLIFSANGEDAYQQIQLFRPEAVIAGTTLENRGGLQLCLDIKSDENCSDIPFFILKNGSEDISDEDHRRVQADGVISRPLRREEILRLINNLKAEGTMKQKEDLFMGDLEKLDDEDIIELVDVVEEPESSVKIGDLMMPEKEQLIGDMTPLEPWDRPVKKKEESAQNDNELTLAFDNGTEKKTDETDLQLESETRTDRIDFEDIFQKVDQIEPSFSKEPVETGEEPSSLERESPDKVFSLEEFETALHQEMRPEPVAEERESVFRETPSAEVGQSLEAPQPVPPPGATAAAPEEDFQSLFQEESLEEIPGEVSLEEEPLDELPEEGFSESLLEEDMSQEKTPSRPVRVEAEAVQGQPAAYGAGLDATRLEEHAHEAISKAIQTLMEDFVKTVIPDITQYVMTRTMERIEQMVKEMLPELAQKAIQEEIKRLQGE